MGLATIADDLDRFVDALTVLATDGPRWTYRSSPDGTDCWPDPDPDPRPRRASPSTSPPVTVPSYCRAQALPRLCSDSVRGVSARATTIWARFRTPSLR